MLAMRLPAGSPIMHFAVRRLVLLALVLACATVVAQEEHRPQGEEEMPKLFDFDFYKQAFGKTYASNVEELVRKTLFMARAFKAFVSGVAYKFRQSSHYLALNFMSDQTPSERAAMRNKLMARRAAEEASRLARGGGGRSETPAKRDEQAKQVDPESLERLIERDIKQLVSGNAGVEYADLLSDEKQTGSAKVRRKRSSAEEPRKSPRDLSFKLLIKLPNPSAGREPPEVRAKIRVRVPSNNPNYEQIEMSTRGLIDQQRPINKWKIDPPEARSLLSAFKSAFGYFIKSTPSLARDLEPEVEEDQEDKMFFDHRDSGCLFTPRNQGNCGACYAFTGISYIEWLHCKKTGNLVAFSEQYMVDCGYMRVDKDALLGCEGAYMEAVPKFVHNFGVELRANYPYRTRLDQCPYDDATDLNSVGYIRMNLGDFVEVPRERWEEYIEFSPLFIGVATPPDFGEYGGGVDSGAGCPRDPDHAMLLVGHGREDGQEYWLIRNSYSPGWGDMGHYKLSKQAPKRCIDRNIGMAFGSRDARTYDVAPRANPLNDQSVVQKHYSKALNDEVS